jgi:hypothetical protein
MARIQQPNGYRPSNIARLFPIQWSRSDLHHIIETRRRPSTGGGAIAGVTMNQAQTHDPSNTLEDKQSRDHGEYG